MLLHLHNDVDRNRRVGVETLTRDVQCLVNRRLLSFLEFDVNGRADNL
jgi:hypothetical protein